MSALELLSPARNLESGIAAIDHGADAVYIGAARFGARAAAGNSTDDIRQLCDYAHQEVPRTHELAESIQKNGNAIADLLDNLIHISDEEPGKGGSL